MHRTRKHYSTKSRRFDLSIVHRQLDAEGSSVLQAETNRVDEKMQILKKWGRKEQVLKEEAERELEKVKEQLKVATEEKNKLEQRLKDEEEKSILQNQELEAEEAKNLQLTQQLQSVNAHLEHYRQVCAKVQTLEGAYLFLVRILKNRIDECLIAAELQRISRPVLSL